MTTSNVAIIQNVTAIDHRAVYIDGISRFLSKKYGLKVFLQKSERKDIPFSDILYEICMLPGKTYSIPGQIQFIANAFQALKKENIDIFHCINPFSSVISPLLLTVKKPCKVIYDTRGLWVEFGVHALYFPQWISSTLDFLDVRLMHHCHNVIAISDLLKAILVQKGVKKEKITVVPGGVDPSLFASVSPANLWDTVGIEEGRVIGYVGSISKARSSEKVIEAFNLVHKKEPTAHLVMVGPIADHTYFHSLVNQYNLEEYIHLTGFIKDYKDIPRFMKSFDVAVSFHPFNLPIYNVMVPNKILEYLCAGVPIVASDNMSHTSLLRDGVDSILVAQDAASLSEGMLRILNDNNLAKKLAENAKKTAEKYYFEKIAGKVMQVYES